MASQKNVPHPSWIWLMIYLLIFGELIAFTEVFSFPFFDWLSKIGGPNKSVIWMLFSLECILDTFTTQSLRLNIMVWWAIVLLVLILNSLVWLCSKNLRNQPQKAKFLIFGLSLGLLVCFGALITFNQFYHSVPSSFKGIYIVGFLLLITFIIAGLFLYMRSSSAQRFQVGGSIWLGIGLFLLFNFPRNFLEKASQIGLVLSAGFFLFLLCLIVFISWYGRDKKPSFRLVKLKKILGIGFILLGILIILLPALEWYKVLLPGFKHPIKSLESGKIDLPNVIMIVLDTTRADHLSLYGYSRKTSPFLDRLGAQSVVFERAFATAPWTLPSHASFFTGLYPSEHNCHYENMRLAKKYKTLAEILAQKGYFTLGYSNNEILTRFSGVPQGFSRFIEAPKLRLFTGETINLFFNLLIDPSLWHDNGARRANPIIKRWLKTLYEHRVRFFLFINYMEAHIPYPQFPEAFSFFEDPKQAREKLLGHIPQYDIYNCGPEEVNEQKEEAINWYDGSIYYLDQHLAELYQFLDENKYLDNTILIILSDHGESLGEHNLFDHAIGLYQQLLWVPLIIYYPPVLKPMRVNRVISLKDLPEMTLRLIEGRIPEQISSPLVSHQPIFAEVFIFHSKLEKFKNFCPESSFFIRLQSRQKAVISGPYKLIWDSRGRNELYQYELDADEIDNLIHREPKIFAELNSAIQLFLHNHPQPAEGTAPELDARTRKALETLGYTR